MTRESVDRASEKYAPARIYANCFDDPRSRYRFVEALAALGVSSLPLGPSAMAVVERAAARKALNLNHDPDQISDSKSRFWKAAEKTILSTGLPFRSTQPMPRSTFTVWDSSRLIRVVFSWADRAVVGAVASGSRSSRRTMILPHVARNLRAGATSPMHGYELDKKGLIGTSQKFDLEDAASWAAGLNFIANYLTNVMHALYDARAAQRKARRRAR